MSRYENTLVHDHEELLPEIKASLLEHESPTQGYDALLSEVVASLQDPELAKLKIPEDLHSILYLGQPEYIRQAKLGEVEEDVAKKRWVADIALTSLWIYAVNRRMDDPEHLRRKDLIEMISQLDDPEITDEYVAKEIDLLINEDRLVKQTPPLLYSSSEDYLGESTLSINFDRGIFQGLKNELEWRRLSQPKQQDLPEFRLAS